MESEHSSPCSPESTTCPRPEPDQSSSPLPSYLMKVHFNIILLFKPTSISCFRISYLSVWAFDVLEMSCLLCRIGPKSSIKYVRARACVRACVRARTHQWNINFTFSYQLTNMTDNVLSSS